jgi:predicted TIM-barrel fold metal-dependent hydrolase
MNNLDVLGLTRMTTKQLREPFNLMPTTKGGNRFGPDPLARLALTKLVAPTQILFGTDFPFLTAKATAAGLRQVGLFNTAELQAIERRNAAQLMPKYKT